MSRQDDIKRLMLIYRRNLQTLEQQQAMSGSDTPPHLQMQIDDTKAQLANLQSELEELEETNVKEPPPKIQDLYYATKTALSEFRQTLDNLSNELTYISSVAQARANDLIEQGKQRFVELEKEWNALDVYSASAEAALKVLQSNLSVARSSLQTLILRHNYRRRFGLLEEKLAGQQLALTDEQLQTTIQPQIDKTQEQIEFLEVKEALTPHDEKMLTIYRRNLELCKQMLARERLYAPLTLLSELIDLGQTLKDIDIQLTQS